MCLFNNNYSHRHMALVMAAYYNLGVK